MASRDIPPRCIGYDGDHINLLVSGGTGSDGRALKDMTLWLFDFKSNKWKEVKLIESSCSM